MNPDYHFLVAQILELMDDPGELYFTFNPAGTGHTPLMGQSLSMSVAENFLAHNLKGIREKSILVDHGYSGVTDLFGKDYGMQGREGSMAYTLREYLKANNKLMDVSGTLFAWNTAFNKFGKAELERYDAEAVLPQLEQFYNDHFGGDE